MHDRGIANFMCKNKEHFLGRLRVLFGYEIRIGIWVRDKKTLFRYEVRKFYLGVR